MKRSWFAAVLAIGLAASLVSAAPPAPFPDTDAGRRAAAYVDAFNSGREETMRAYLEANVSPEALGERPIGRRLEIYKEMLEEHRSLKPVRLVSAKPDEIELLVQNGVGASFAFTLVFEPEAPHRFLGLHVEDAPGGAAPAPPAARMTEPDALKAFRAQLDSLAKADAFSGAVLVAKGDSLLMQTAYGYANRAKRTPNRIDTKFNLGSLNKLFTKLAIGQLVGQGKVRLDDTIDRYLADYPKPAGNTVTVRQLLDHKGGLGDIFGASYDRADKSKLVRVSDWLPLFRDRPPAFEPGSRQQYSNAGYVVLGAIVEQASGEDYYDYLRRHIYEPLGLKSTDSYRKSAATGNLAIGYTRDEERGLVHDAAGWADNAPTRPERGSPAGGGFSTAADLLAFTRALRGGRLLDRAAVGEAFREFTPDNGQDMGFAAGGGAPGTNAAIELSGPYTIIVLANMDPPAAERPAATMASWLPGGSAGGQRVIRRVGAGSPEAAAAASAGGVRRVVGGNGEHGALDAPTRTSIPASGVNVPMERSEHIPVVSVMVNGKGPYKFGIDTGGAGTCRLDSTLVAKLGLEVVGQVRAGDPSGKNTRTMDLVKIDTIELGGAKFEGMTAAVRDYNAGRTREPVDGILGFGLFQAGLLTLDYPANRVRFERGELPAVNGKDVLAFDSRNGVPSIQLKVDSMWVDADVDAGAMGGFMLPGSMEQQLAFASAPKVVGTARTVTNTFEIKAAELQGSVMLGGFEFPHATVGFQPMFPMANVGARVLQDFRVTFDQKNKRMKLVRRPA